MHLWVDSVRALQPIVVRIEKQGHQFLPHKINVPFYSSSTNRIGCPYGVGYLSLAALPTPPAHQAKHQEAVDPRKKGGKAHALAAGKGAARPGAWNRYLSSRLVEMPGGGRRRGDGQQVRRGSDRSVDRLGRWSSAAVTGSALCTRVVWGVVGGDSGVCCKWQFCPFIDLRSLSHHFTRSCKLMEH